MPPSKHARHPDLCAKTISISLTNTMISDSYHSNLSKFYFPTSGSCRFQLQFYLYYFQKIWCDKLIILLFWFFQTVVRWRGGDWLLKILGKCIFFSVKSKICTVLEECYFSYVATGYTLHIHVLEFFFIYVNGESLIYFFFLNLTEL